MTLYSPDLVQVYYHGAGVKQLVGRLLFKNRQFFFEYDGAFIETGLELSPFHLPLRRGVIPSVDTTFEGLFGVFNDSLPDGWGRLLLDRKLAHWGGSVGGLSPLERLCFVGSHGMGALSYEPEHPSATLSEWLTDLDQIDREIQATLAEDDAYIEDLFVLGGSSVGARPKVLLRLNEGDWLIKFRSSLDPKDVGAMEYAYHLMAVRAGLQTPEAKLFPSQQGAGFFGVRRFDRQGDRRIHTHTVSGLLHADHREPSLDYEMIMKATVYLTQDIRECEQQFRHAVFNVLSHNRDDHSKNFAFLMDSHGQWRVSPAYDLTFSWGPATEHATLIMGEGRHPTQHHLLKLAAVGGIAQSRACEIIDQVQASIQEWPIFAQSVGVSRSQMRRISSVLGGVRLDSSWK